MKSLSHVLTLCNPVDCSLPGSSVHGILQAVILEWVVISFSRGSSRPRDRTGVSCIGGRHFKLWATRDALNCKRGGQIWLHIGSVSFTLAFVFSWLCYKLKMLPIAWNTQDGKNLQALILKYITLFHRTENNTDLSEGLKEHHDLTYDESYRNKGFQHQEVYKTNHIPFLLL